MAPRSNLQSRLEEIVDNVYFQPPANIAMVYPCIVYKREAIATEFADNSPYKHLTRYQLMYIDQNPDSTVLEKLSALPMCAYDRFFTADKLNHDIFNIFF